MQNDLKMMHYYVSNYYLMDVKEIVYDLRSLCEKGASVPDLKKKYFSFYENHPTLFDSATDVNFPLKYLDWMFEMKEKVTETNLEEMDKEVYSKLKEEYIPEN